MKRFCNNAIHFVGGVIAWCILAIFLFLILMFIPKKLGWNVGGRIEILHHIAIVVCLISATVYVVALAIRKKFKFFAAGITIVATTVLAYYLFVIAVFSAG